LLVMQLLLLFRKLAVKTTVEKSLQPKAMYLSFRCVVVTTCAPIEAQAVVGNAAVVGKAAVVGNAAVVVI
jgi:hypothetical protein